MPSSSALPTCSYSVVITSCRRFDLLRSSIASLKANLDTQPEAWIVVEDSDDERVRACVKDLGIDATVLVNGKQIGQILSIDKAYAEVRTPYVFHSEDDWEFYRTGFIQESVAILERQPNFSMIGLRARNDQNPLVRNMPRLEQDGIGYFVLDPKLHPEYFSYCFNPGLRRMADYRKVGPFATIVGIASMPMV